MNTGKAKSTKIKLIDEYFDDPNRIVLGDVIVQRLGQQKRLSAVFTFDETTHRQPSKIKPILADSGAFLHTLAPLRTQAERHSCVKTGWQSTTKSPLADGSCGASTYVGRRVRNMCTRIVACSPPGRSGRGARP